MPPLWSPTGEVIIAVGGVERLKRGQLNIFVKWLSSVRGPVESGDLVIIKDRTGDVLGMGFYEGIGAMAVRVLTRDVEDAKAVLRRRLEGALRLRERLKLDNFFRWVHSESDSLPGLILDVYDDVVVLSSTSVGIDRRIEEISAMIRDLYGPSSIVLRNDSRPRKEVELPYERKLLLGKKSRSIIREGGALFHVDALSGQKTGFFIDQRLNRIEIEHLVGPGDKVLDLYSYTGGFAIHAALSGADTVAVDESEYAIKELRANSQLNSVDVVPIQSTVKEYLERDSSLYDLVIVDPPALASSRSMIHRAKKTYVAVNAAAMERVTSGGLMFTSSCSQFISKEEFKSMVSRAAESVGRKIRILGERGASPDHPTDPIHPWTSYLKGLLIEVD